MNDIHWNKIILDDFRYLSRLTEEEELILQDWEAGRSVTKTAMDRSMSDRKVERLRNQIRRKYDAVQPYSPLLPKRIIAN
jgi:hypothetical protein